MRKNRVISRKLAHNLEGWYGYHISKNSKLYKYNDKLRRIKKRYAEYDDPLPF